MAEGSSGERLDTFLAAALADHSRSRWHRAIEDGLVKVDGKVASAGLKLKAGMMVEALEPEAPPSTLEPEEREIHIIHEEEDFLVVDKPAGLVVHPGAGQWTGTLANALLHRFRDLPTGGGADRPGIVHRLDKDTSGLLLVARSERAHRALSKALADRDVERRYWGMVWGDPGAEGLVEAPIGRHPRERVKMAVVESGRQAATEFRRITNFGFAAEVELKLRTGRTHQIRVHLAHIRHPVVGDLTYGGVVPIGGVMEPVKRQALIAAARRVGRQALHAQRLRFKHPFGDAMLEFESPLPEDLVQLRSSFRAQA